MSDSWLPAHIVKEERKMAESKGKGKEWKTTIRHTEEEEILYKKEADKLNISKSEYIRLAVKDMQQEHQLI